MPFYLRLPGEESWCCKKTLLFWKLWPESLELRVLTGCPYTHWYRFWCNYVIWTHNPKNQILIEFWNMHVAGFTTYLPISIFFLLHVSHLLAGTQQQKQLFPDFLAASWCGHVTEFWRVGTLLGSIPKRRGIPIPSTFYLPASWNVDTIEELEPAILEWGRSLILWISEK